MVDTKGYRIDNNNGEYWNKITKEWVDIEDATIFTFDETEEYELPKGGAWAAIW